MRKNKKLFAILTLVAFMMTLMPVLAFGDIKDASKITLKKTSNASGVTLTIDLGGQTANANSSLTYQWTKDGSDISGETNDTLANITATGSYSVKISGADAADSAITNGAALTAISVETADLAAYNAAVAAMQVTVDALDVIIGDGVNAGKIAFKITDNTKMPGSVILKVYALADNGKFPGTLGAAIAAPATAANDTTATTTYIPAPAVGTSYGISVDTAGTDTAAANGNPQKTVTFTTSDAEAVQDQIDLVVTTAAVGVKDFTVTAGVENLKTVVDAKLTNSFAVTNVTAAGDLTGLVSSTGNTQDTIAARISGPVTFTVSNGTLTGTKTVNVTINPATQPIPVPTTVADAVNALNGITLDAAASDTSVAFPTKLDSSLTVSLYDVAANIRNDVTGFTRTGGDVTGLSLRNAVKSPASGNVVVEIKKAGETTQYATITLRIAAGSNGNASLDASVFATVEANATIESDSTATNNGTINNSANWLDTKYAELDLVFRADRNNTATPVDVYIWAEENGRSRQATDAFVLNVGTPVATISAHKVYKVPASALNAGANTLKVAFLRGGTYNIKASFADPVAGVNAGESLKSVATFKDVSSKNTVTVTSPAQESRLFTIDVVAGTNKTVIDTNVKDGETTAKAVAVAADTVATTKVTITVKNKTGNLMTTYPVRLSTNSANVELDKTNVSTDYKGEASFNVAGIREGEYKIYVTIGDYESTILVQVGATSANDIQLIKFPSNPIATDTLVADYKDIFRFQLTDANGNIVTGRNPRGARYASLDSSVPASEKTSAEMAKYAYIVSAPEANKVKNADLKLAYVASKDYYTLGIDNNKAFEAEGDYEVRVVLDNGKSATLNFSVKKFDKAVSLHIEYPTTAVELNSVTEAPDIYFLDANRVMKKANNRVTVAAQGYAVASVIESGNDAGTLSIKNDEKYVGQTITVTAASDKENLMASTTLTVADEAREVKLDTNRGPVNANNRVGFKVVDSTGTPVALGREATVEVTAVVTNTGDPDAKVSYSVTGSSRNDLREKGTGVINLSSNKQTTATVQIMVKVTKNAVNQTNANDNNTGLSTTYYSGTETFTFGAEADKSVVMTIGSKEIVAQNVPVTIDVAPFIQDNRTYVPFRALVEAFGAEVDYNADNNTVTTKLNGKTVVLTVGSTVLTVNDETVTMDVAPFIVDDRVVVPVRFVGEAFGFTVEATQDADTGATASVVFYQK